MSDLSEGLAKIALAKALSKLEAQPIEPGKYNVDLTANVHVRGTLDKLPDTLYTPTADIPLKSTLALVLQYAGVTREAAAEMLVRAMTEALAAGTGCEAAIQARLADVDAAMNRVKAIAAALPKKPRAGSLLSKFDVVEVAILHGEDAVAGKVA